MSKIKELFVKSMNVIMLDCDEATLYALKDDSHSLGCLKRMQLKMHLASCEYCKSFVEQSKIINEKVNSIKEIDESNLTIHLTKQQKVNLQDTVETRLNNN